MGERRGPLDTARHRSHCGHPSSMPSGERPEGKVGRWREETKPGPPRTRLWLEGFRATAVVTELGRFGFLNWWNFYIKKMVQCPRAINVLFCQTGV